MNRQRRTGLLAVAALLTLSGVTFAQPQPYVRQGTNPYSTPPLSPWLNMLRGGDPSVNYYLGVVPEFRQRTLNSQFNSQMQMLNQRQEAADSPEMNDLLPTLPGTGHATAFMNASPYFALNPYLGQTAGVPRRPQGKTGRPGGK
jgi:hypothetical protein